VIKRAEIVKEAVLLGLITRKIVIVKLIIFAKCLAKKLKNVLKAIICVSELSVTKRIIDVVKEIINAPLIASKKAVNFNVNMIQATIAVNLTIVETSIHVLKNARMKNVLRLVNLTSILSTKFTLVEKLNVLISAFFVKGNVSFLIIFIQN